MSYGLNIDATRSKSFFNFLMIFNGFEKFFGVSFAEVRDTHPLLALLFRAFCFVPHFMFQGFYRNFCGRKDGYDRKVSYFRIKQVNLFYCWRVIFLAGSQFGAEEEEFGGSC